MPTLVILAAGKGSRFGGPKQLKRFGPLNGTLMEYNICHALDAGFTKVVFIVHEDLLEDFNRDVIPFLSPSLTVRIVVQSFNNLPNGCRLPEKRVKPLGTAHAVWCAKEVVEGDFAVINADDYYGSQAFKLLYSQYKAQGDNYLLVGFLLDKTLSEHGSVNRGVCKVSNGNRLVAVTEYENIKKISENIVGETYSEVIETLAMDTLVSMNCWLFNEDIFSAISKQLIALYNVEEQGDFPERLTKECYLPDVVMNMLSISNKEVNICTTHDEWFGITYTADTELVSNKIIQMTKEGVFNSLSYLKT